MKAYDITQSVYWRKCRQGVRKGPHGSSGRYNRRKRNSDIRWGARNNFRRSVGHDDLWLGNNGKFRRRAKGLIRAQRSAIERYEAQQARLREMIYGAATNTNRGHPAQA